MITQDDEDRARTLLREHADGPYRWGARAPAATVPEMALSDDARVVLLAPQVLRQAGWRGEPFLGVKLQDPTWTRARWARAQAELTQWRVQQAQARQQGSDVEALAVSWVSGEGRDTEDVEETDDGPQQGQTPKEDRMREHTGPQIDGTGPDDRRPPLHPADDLAQLEGVLQQLQQTLEDHADDPLWAPLQVTHEAVALAQSLLHGWQVQQAMTQGCLTQWQQTLQALETVGVALQRQAETHQAQTVQLRRAPWWAFLAGVGLMGLVALGVWRPTPPPDPVPPWQALRPLPRLPEPVRPSEEPTSAMPDAPLAPEAEDAPAGDGP